MNYRAEFLKTLSGFAKKIQSEISSEELTLCYEPNLKCTDNIFEYLEQQQSREIEYGSSLFGIQRDDISIFVANHDTRLFASQGQQRTIALAMKLGEVELYKQETSETPVLLLDDIMSELDPLRQNYILNHIKGKQVFLSCCDPSNIKNLKKGKIFNIQKGEIKE